MGSYSELYFDEVEKIARGIDRNAVERIAAGLARLRAEGGRLFFLGMGGSAANCSHAVNDFRKIDGIEAYFPGDNIAELTARANDEGLDTIFAAWLETSRACKKDAIFVLSVGGGSIERGISISLVRAIDEAHSRGMMVYGIVGRADGYTSAHGDEVIVVPLADESRVTPHSEAFQGVILHAIASHPDLARPVRRSATPGAHP